MGSTLNFRKTSRCSQTESGINEILIISNNYSLNETLDTLSTNHIMNIDLYSFITSLT